MTNAEADDSGHRTVLVVEDDVLIRIAISEYLRHCGFRVIEVVSADEALSVFAEVNLQVDILFSDIEMPGSMNGFGLAKWVRENRPGVQTILTGSVKDAANAAGKVCEHGPHLEKPYQPQQVVEWIKRLRASAPK